jgi:peptide/nickel transport system substrate-binding protein
MMKRHGSLSVLVGPVVLAMLVLVRPCAPATTPTPKPPGALLPAAIPVATPVQAAEAMPRPSDAGMLRAPEPSPKRGGILKWGGLANSTLYDLHQTGTIANMGPQAPMYDLLVQADPVNWNVIIPDLAKSWKVADDGLTYTFYLREGVKFHDGAPLTAEDVVASFNHIIFPPPGVISPRRGLFEAVKEVVATEELMVEFRLKEPSGFLLRAIAAGFNVIVRKKTLEENNYDLRRVSAYPGSGPFRHKSLEPGVVRKLERNPDYWNAELPYLDGIEVFHLEFGPKTGAACLAHTIDFCWGIDPISERKAKNIKGLNTTRIYPTAPFGLFLNFKTKPFDDVRVRRAINLVLDKAALVDAVAESVGVVRAGWVLPTDPFFKEYWEKVKEQPGWRSPTAEDIAEAKRLMKEAGYEHGIKGLDFVVRDIPFQIAWAPIVQDILKRELKIESNIRQVASGVWYEEASGGRYDLTIYAFGVTLPHVADYWANWMKTQGGYNFIPYSNPEFDAIVAATARESDSVKLRELMEQGIKILDRDIPNIVFASAFIPIAWWDNVKGHGTATKGANFWEGMRNEIWWLAK